ncbi:LysR substrate-binding domain-containing protein [Pseudomonas sp. RW10S2]|uniref:LysR substrate-binding domain-containing protein n=1 Tax=Pseudomonas sp. RW10S2 TaxID=459637 RepID=UPI001EE226CC|nr:LysR substrate-binding domain-containing protein [Pseudomonas sp. RW10S2]
MQSLAQSFEAIGHGLNTLEDYRKAPVGRLRLNIPHDAGRLLILPVLDQFLSRFPQVHLDLVMDDRMLDIVAEGFDAGIRFGATVPRT